LIFIPIITFPFGTDVVGFCVPPLPPKKVREVAPLLFDVAALIVLIALPYN
jgi:hypothetical protein